MKQANVVCENIKSFSSVIGTFLIFIYIFWKYIWNEIHRKRKQVRKWHWILEESLILLIKSILLFKIFLFQRNRIKFS